MSQDSTTISSATEIHSPEAGEVGYLSYAYLTPTDSCEGQSMIESNSNIQGGMRKITETRKLILKQPIFVSLSYSPEGEIWVVDCPELNLYGEGKDEQQAVEDFKIVIEEFYFSLKKDKEKLGPDLKKKWDILQRVIKEE